MPIQEKGIIDINDVFFIKVKPQQTCQSEYKQDRIGHSLRILIYLFHISSFITKTESQNYKRLNLIDHFRSITNEKFFKGSRCHQLPNSKPTSALVNE